MSLGFMAGLANATAGFMHGQMDEKERQDEKARRSRMEQIVLDRAKREQEAYDRENADRDTLRKAAAPIPVEQTGGLPPTMDNRDVGQPGEAPVSPPAYRVGMQSYTQETEAKKAAEKQRHGNIESALTAQNPAKGLDYKAALAKANLTEEQARQAITEAQNQGLQDALNAAANGASVEEVKRRYNAQGSKRVASLTIEPIEVNHPVLGKTRSARLVGTMEDGSPFEVKDAAGSAFALFNASKQFDMLAKAKQHGENREDKKRDDDRLDRYTDAQISHMRSTDARADRKIAEDDKIPPAVKAQYASFTKQLETINTAITKAQAEGSWDPASPGAKQLLVQQRVLQAKAERLITPYVPNSTAAADPLGLNSPAPAAAAPAAAPAPRPAPAQSTMQQVAAAGPRYGDPALEKVMQERDARIAALEANIEAANAQLRAAAKSGDPNAMTHYSKLVQQAVAERDAALRK